MPLVRHQAGLQRHDAQAGVGDTVLVLREGNGVRQILRRTDADPLPILELIVGIVDHVEIVP